MFSFEKPKKRELVQGEREAFLAVLTNLEKLLNKDGLTAQVHVIRVLIDLLKERKDDEFKRLLNGIDMWGGSGAVWEVHFEDNASMQEFEIEILKLIDLMEKADVLGKGIIPIRRIFISNLENKERY